MAAIYSCPDCAALVSGDTGVRLHQTWHENLEQPAHELDVQNWPGSALDQALATRSVTPWDEAR